MPTTIRLQDPEGHAPIRTCCRHSRTSLEGRPEAANLLGIYAALADERHARRPAPASPAAIVLDLQGRRSPISRSTKLGPITAEMRRLEDDPGAYRADSGARVRERARAIAEPILREVYDAVGFLPPGSLASA